jgi:hypothetical protein
VAGCRRVSVSCSRGCPGWWCRRGGRSRVLVCSIGGAGWARVPAVSVDGAGLVQGAACGRVGDWTVEYAMAWPTVLGNAKNPEGASIEILALSGLPTCWNSEPRRVGLPEGTRSGLSVASGPVRGCPRSGNDSIGSTCRLRRIRRHHRFRELGHPASLARPGDAGGGMEVGAPL